jgi:hypothetical protein
MTRRIKEAAIARQWHNKNVAQQWNTKCHVSVATFMHATIEELWEAVFSVGT